jgi:hypothetical protein
MHGIPYTEKRGSGLLFAVALQKYSQFFYGHYLLVLAFWGLLL